MRGCLFVLVAGAIAVVLAIVVGLPWAASGLVEAGLGAAGLEAADTTVTVSSDPPTDLLALHADRVRVRATNATFRGMTIGALDLALTDVDVLARTARGVDGTLRRVVVDVPGGAPVRLDTITLGGTGDEVTASSVVSGAEAETLVSDAIERKLGTRPTSVTLSAPDLITVKLGTTITGHLAVSPGGDLVARGAEGLGAGAGVVLVSAADLPVRLTRVRVTSAGDLRLDGILEVGILG